MTKRDSVLLTKSLVLSATFCMSAPALSDIEHADDVIITQSLCVGLDCVNGENFGYDTIRLKENNLRIHFDDTSASGSFPTNDWRIIINDTTNSGANYFAIEDSTGGKVPFKIEASAPTNSLYVDSSGRIGVGTGAPVVEAHIVDGDSPTIRLEQDGSSGFTAQTWDLAGNETNFFIRDVTNGSKLSFRIKTGAPGDSIFVAANGDIGLGTDAPSGRLHVKALDGGKADLVLDAPDSSPDTPQWAIINKSNNLNLNVPGSGKTEASLDNQGNLSTSGSLLPLDIKLADVINTSSVWRVVNKNGAFRVTLDGSGKIESEIDSSGNLSISGTLSQGSSRSFKTNILPVNIEEIVDKLTSLPMATWSYINSTDVQHIGPMAEDFYKQFNLGTDEKHIAPGDMAAIALISAQKTIADNQLLSERLSQKEQEINVLKVQLESISKRLSALEKVEQ